MQRLLGIVTIVIAIQAITAISAYAFNADPLPNPEPPFVVCKN